MKKSSIKNTTSPIKNVHKYDSVDTVYRYEIDRIIDPILNKNESYPSGCVPTQEKKKSFNENRNGEKINDFKHSIKTSDKIKSECHIELCTHFKFDRLLSISPCDIKKLSELSWNGIPWCIRGKVWRILTGYIPTKIEDQQETLLRKRKEYQNFVSQYFNYRNSFSNDEHYRQIIIDIPRTHPNLKLLHDSKIVELYERILFIWAIRHPACGYVQGINDLIAPFLIVYLYEYIGKNYDVKNISTNISENILNNIESDIYWTFSHLLDGIQDNYTPDQPGIQKRVRLLEKIISFADRKLYQFLLNIDIQFLQFSLRWMNNLLVREIPIECTIRLWDTYFAENNGFDQLHLFVCAAFLIKFSNIIVRLQDFQEVSYFVQNLPTQSWKEDDIAVLLAEAFQLQFLYSNILERD